MSNNIFRINNSNDFYTLNIPKWNLQGIFICSSRSESSYIVSSAMKYSNYILNSSSYKMFIFSRGSANLITVNSLCSMTITTGGTATLTTINSNGIIYVHSGGSAISITQNSKGIIYLTIPGAYVNGAGIYGSLHFEGSTVNNSTLQYIHLALSSGCTTNLNNLNTSARFFIKQNGIANATTVNSQGFIYVSSGGVANFNNINTSGSIIVSARRYCKLYTYLFLWLYGCFIKTVLQILQLLIEYVILVFIQAEQQQM